MDTTKKTGPWAKLYEKWILFIEPKTGIEEPVNDELSEAMQVALDEGTDGLPENGVHFCICGAHSRPWSTTLKGIYLTNSLSVHYLVHHRSAIPEEELTKVRNYLIEQGYLKE